MRNVPTVPMAKCVRNAANVLTVPVRTASVPIADSVLTAERCAPAAKDAKSVPISVRNAGKHVHPAVTNSAHPVISAGSVLTNCIVKIAVSAATVRRSARSAGLFAVTVRRVYAKNAVNVPDVWIYSARIAESV